MSCSCRCEVWAGTPEYTASCGDLLTGPKPGLSSHKASDPRTPGGGRFGICYSPVWRCPGRKWTKRRRTSEPRDGLLGGKLRAVQAGKLSPHRKWVPSGLHPCSSSGEAVIPRQLLRNHSLDFIFWPSTHANVAAALPAPPQPGHVERPELGPSRWRRPTQAKRHRRQRRLPALPAPEAQGTQPLRRCLQSPVDVRSAMASAPCAPPAWARRDPTASTMPPPTRDAQPP